MSLFRQLFYMQKSDRRILMTLLAVVAVALAVLFWADGASPADTETGAQPTDSAATRDGRPARQPQYYKVAERTVELFDFDPNTADSTQLLRLGLQPWQVRNIYKYRAAGGVYRTRQDFARLYGLTVGQYRRLEPHIKIGADYQPAATLLSRGGSQPRERDTTRLYPVKIKPTEHVVLNTADTAQLVSVPGIGPYFARQVVRYGQRLGGYVSVGQLDEIDDFPADAKAYFVVESPAPRRLNLNRLTLNELRRHPYINYYQAKAITDLRRLKGPLHSLQDLRLCRDFTDDDLSRLQPYVEF